MTVSDMQNNFSQNITTFSILYEGTLLQYELFPFLSGPQVFLWSDNCDCFRHAK